MREERLQDYEPRTEDEWLDTLMEETPEFQLGAVRRGVVHYMSSRPDTRAEYPPPIAPSPACQTKAKAARG